MFSEFTGIVQYLKQSQNDKQLFIYNKLAGRCPIVTEKLFITEYHGTYLLFKISQNYLFDDPILNSMIENLLASYQSKLDITAPTTFKHLQSHIIYALEKTPKYKIDVTTIFIPLFDFLSRTSNDELKKLLLSELKKYKMETLTLGESQLHKIHGHIIFSTLNAHYKFDDEELNLILEYITILWTNYIEKEYKRHNGKKLESILKKIVEGYHTRSSIQELTAIVNFLKKSDLELLSQLYETINIYIGENPHKASLENVFKFFEILITLYDFRHPKLNHLIHTLITKTIKVYKLEYKIQKRSAFVKLASAEIEQVIVKFAHALFTKLIETHKFKKYKSIKLDTTELTSHFPTLILNFDPTQNYQTYSAFEKDAHRLGYIKINITKSGITHSAKLTTEETDEEDERYEIYYNHLANYPESVLELLSSLNIDGQVKESLEQLKQQTDHPLNKYGHNWMQFLFMFLPQNDIKNFNQHTLTYSKAYAQMLSLIMLINASKNTLTIIDFNLDKGEIHIDRQLRFNSLIPQIKLYNGSYGCVTDSTDPIICDSPESPFYINFNLKLVVQMSQGQPYISSYSHDLIDYTKRGFFINLAEKHLNYDASVLANPNAIHIATMTNNIEEATELLSHNPQLVFEIDEQQKLPVDYAIILKNQALINLLAFSMLKHIEHSTEHNNWIYTIAISINRDFLRYKYTEDKSEFVRLINAIKLEQNIFTSLHIYLNQTIGTQESSKAILQNYRTQLLHAAITKDDIEGVKASIKYGSDLHAKFNEETALQRCAGNSKMQSALLIKESSAKLFNKKTVVKPLGSHNQQLVTPAH